MISFDLSDRSQVFRVDDNLNWMDISEVIKGERIGLGYWGVVEKEFGKDGAINSDRTIWFPRQPYWHHLEQLTRATDAVW